MLEKELWSKKIAKKRIKIGDSDFLYEDFGDLFNQLENGGAFQTNLSKIKIKRVENGSSSSKDKTSSRSKNQKKIDINSLLGRAVISVENPKLAAHFLNKTILVTGAAGSIGSGLAAALLQQKISKLILLDQAESALFDLEQRFQKTETTVQIEYVIGDICDAQRME